MLRAGSRVLPADNESWFRNFLVALPSYDTSGGPSNRVGQRLDFEQVIYSFTLGELVCEHGPPGPFVVRVRPHF